MDKLWAPWRIKYVAGKKSKKCIFCNAGRGNNGDYVIFKTKYSVSLLNAFPYNNGHAMVAPLRHVKDIALLSQEEVLDLMSALNRTRCMLDKVLKPEGYNVGINLTAVAGAGITGHLHMHIVPRWKGDVNFMTAVFNTRIISQSLRELHKKLKSHAGSKTNR